MKSNILKYAACAAMVLGLAVNVQATLISGNVSLAGNFIPTGGDINTATSFASFNNTMVTGADGNFTGLTLFTPGTITMVPFTFAPLPGAGITPLWTAVGGTTLGASFDLLTIDYLDRSRVGILDLTGTGIFHLTGFDPTPGFWRFSGNQAGGTLSFSSSQGTTVPDGGVTVILLGGALSALGLIRRKLA